MSELTVKDLKAKLLIIEKDLESLRREGGSIRKVEVLTEYKSYIQDEIKMREDEERSNSGS